MYQVDMTDGNKDSDPAMGDGVRNNDNDKSSSTMRTTTSNSPFSSCLSLPWLLESAIDDNNVHNKSKNRKIVMSRMSSSSSFSDDAVHKAIQDTEAVLDHDLSEIYSSCGSDSNSEEYCCALQIDNDQENDSICWDLRQLDSWEDDVRAELERAEHAWRNETANNHDACTPDLIASEDSGDNDTMDGLTKNAIEDTKTKLTTDEEEEVVEGLMSQQTQSSMITTTSNLGSFTGLEVGSSTAVHAIDFATPESNNDNIPSSMVVSTGCHNIIPVREDHRMGGALDPQYHQEQIIRSLSVTLAYDVLASELVDDNRSILCHWLHQQKLHWPGFLLNNNVGVKTSTPSRLPTSPTSISSRDVGPQATSINTDPTVIPAKITNETRIPLHHNSAKPAKITNEARIPLHHNSAKHVFESHYLSHDNVWKIGVPVMGSATVSNDGQLRMIFLCGVGDEHGATWRK